MVIIVPHMIVACFVTLAEEICATGLQLKSAEMRREATERVCKLTACDLSVLAVVIPDCSSRIEDREV